MIKVDWTTQGGGGEGDCDEIFTIEVTIFSYMSPQPEMQTEVKCFILTVTKTVITIITVLSGAIMVINHQTEENGAWNGLLAITAPSHVVVSHCIDQ